MTLIMKNKKCVDCIEYKRCRDSYTSWLFFIIGLVATVAMRVITVLMYMDPLYGKIAWYIGVGGFFLFFIYKFRVSQIRYRAINKRGLVDKINYKKELAGEDYNLIGAILCSLSSMKERINYIFIFGLSAIALVLAIYMDFIR